MANIKLAKRYAKSILGLATETNKGAEVLDDMILLDTIFKSNKDFKNLTNNPVIAVDKKLSIYKAVLETSVSELTMKFMALLIKKHRENHLDEICIAYKEEYNKLNAIKTLKIYSAKALNQTSIDNIVNKVKQQVTCSGLNIETIINPDLIGGFILEMEDKYFDASIKRDLADVKKQFDKNLYIHNIK